MANHTTVKHGLLSDLKEYLIKTGWTIEEPIGNYEVLRAYKVGRQRPLLIHNRTSGGCGYSIDERDIKVYKGWHKDRRNRGLDSHYPSTDAEKLERESVIRTLK